MTKLGTPIGAGPNPAKVVVGFAAVGAPPWLKAALPPSPIGCAGWTPAGGGGAVTRPPVLTAVPPPVPLRGWLWVTPPEAGASAALSEEPDSTPPAGCAGASSSGA